MLNPQPLDQPLFPPHRSRIRLPQPRHSASLHSAFSRPPRHRRMLPPGSKKPIQPFLPQLRLPCQSPPRNVIHVRPGTFRRHTDPAVRAVIQVPVNRHPVHAFDARAQTALLQRFGPVGEDNLRHPGKRHSAAAWNTRNLATLRIHSLTFTTYVPSAQSSSPACGLDILHQKHQLSTMKQAPASRFILSNTTSGHLYCSRREITLYCE